MGRGKDLMNRSARLLAAISLTILLLTGSAQANVGAPMLAVVWPCAWVLLIPIILVEALVAMRVLKQDFRAGLKTAGKANLISTFVGIPVTWILLLLIELMFWWAGTAWDFSLPVKKTLAVTVQSPWLDPWESEFYWMVPAASAVLCVPFFFMSVWVENRVARRFFGKERSARACSGGLGRPTSCHTG